MIALPRTDCHRHRSELLDFADHRDVTAVDAASLEHLDRCSDCRLEVEAAALAVIALRRLGVEASRAEPPADGWPRLRARVGRHRAPWRWRAPLAGLLVSAGLVAVVLAPAAYLRPPAPFLQEAGLQASIFDARRAAEDLTEQRVMEQQRAARTAPVPLQDPGTPAIDLRTSWPGPDGLKLERQALVAPAPTILHR